MGEYECVWFWVDDPPKAIVDSEFGSIFATIPGCNMISSVNWERKTDEYGKEYWDVK